MDADTERIVASALTDNDADDASHPVDPLLDRMGGAVASFTADGAYDCADVYGEVAAWHPGDVIIVLPQSSAVASDTAETAPTQRGRHLEVIAEHGRMGWQGASGYN
jgi:hypothetical protein